jgi:hypothetical protein
MQERVTVVDPYPRSRRQCARSEPSGTLMIVRTVAGHNLDPRRTSTLLRCCAARAFKPIVRKSRDYQAVRGVGIGPGNVDKKLFIHLVTSFVLLSA